MWLINTHALQLEEFAGAAEAGVRYAILSHTWEDEEVTFQEFRSGDWRAKKGFAKIEQACKLAVQDGYTYVWVDSCCINKESSAELTMAINSMWRWYWESSVCFTYLSDLSGDCPFLEDPSEVEPEDLGTTSVDPWYEQLAQCRWFARGFTLQELLAPNTLHFFNSQWTFIGTKRSLIATVSNITGIDQIALRDRELLRSCTIAKRMSWAADRKTRYIEDRAYSLLGLFNVNMPLLYGEGERAFIRLQEEIIKTSTDHSIFIWEPLGTLEEQARADLLFASSPDQFRHCKKVVRYQEVRADSHAHLTNRGLIFDALHVCRSKHGNFAVLNCRLEHDLRGPLALRLSTEDELSLKFERYTLLTKDECWIGMSDRDRGSDRTDLLEDWSVHDRLIVYPSGDFPRTSFTDSKTTLLRMHPATLASQTLGQGQWPAVWLKHDENDIDSIPFVILGAYPLDYWSRKTGTFNASAIMRPGKVVTAVVEVLLKRLNHKIFLAFSITAPASVDKSYEDGLPDGVEFRFVLSATSGAHSKQLLQETTPSRKAYLNLQPSQRVKARLQLEQHLGQIVFVISFSSKNIDPVQIEARQKKVGKVRKNYPGGGYSGGGGPLPRDPPNG